MRACQYHRDGHNQKQAGLSNVRNGVQTFGIPNTASNLKQETNLRHSYEMTTSKCNSCERGELLSSNYVFGRTPLEVSLHILAILDIENSYVRSPGIHTYDSWQANNRTIMLLCQYAHQVRNACKATTRQAVLATTSQIPAHESVAPSPASNQTSKS